MSCPVRKVVADAGLGLSYAPTRYLTYIIDVVELPQQLLSPLLISNCHRFITS